MKFGQKYLSSSYGAIQKPSLVQTIVDYASKWKKVAVGIIDTWTRN